MNVKNRITTELLREFHTVLSIHYYPNPTVLWDDFENWCYNHGCTTNKAILNLIQYFKDRDIERLRNYRAIAPRLEKNLIKIVSDNSQSLMDPIFGFSDADLTDPRYEIMGFDLFSIDSIHWFCHASGWRKEPIQVSSWYEDECCHSYIDIWVPPNVHLYNKTA